MGREKVNSILRRLLRYGDKQYRIGCLLDGISDSRQKPVIATGTVLRSVLVMGLAQAGSLNALVQTKGAGFWKSWIESGLPSASTLGRVCARVLLDDLRNVIYSLYTQLKRNKAIRPLPGGFMALVLDGHESNASYVRSCPQCLTRTIHTARGDAVQYYHRYVMAQLWCKSFTLCLDLESPLPGEDEVAAALRLLDRVCTRYPRAFTLILGDGLYSRASVFAGALRRRKHVITVLKDDRRDVLKDAYSVMKIETPLIFQEDGCRYECWDVEQLATWDTLPVKARVVCSRETTVAKNPVTKQKEENTSLWTWASELSQEQLPTREFVHLAHGRWNIENHGFNELVNQWNADHVYCHQALETFWLMIMLSYNLFHAFFLLNLKPQVRKRYSKLFLASLIATELLASGKYINSS